MMLVLEKQRRQLGLRGHDVVAYRFAVDPKPERVDQNELSYAGRVGCGDLRRDHPAERMSHHRRRLEPELVEQVVVVEDEIPEIVQRLYSVLVTLGEAGMRQRVNGEVLRELIDEFGFDKPVAAVKVHKRRAASGDSHLGMNLVAPHTKGLFLARHLCSQSLPGLAGSKDERGRREAGPGETPPSPPRFRPARPRPCRWRSACAAFQATTCSPIRPPKRRGSAGEPRGRTARCS